MTRWGRVGAIAALSALCSCNPPPPAASDAGPSDGATGICSFDRDCDDGVFCNGRETCTPTSPAADAHGCVAPSGPACTAPMTCNEAMATCIAGCADADGDGHGPIDCGGDDCDDEDATRHPGASEVCDAASVDEDCDPATVGERDLDGDGVTSASCCNGAACGADCDDLRRDANPTAPEVCDSIDNDCDAATDEGLILPQYLDGDHDGIGDLSRPLTACPGTPGVSAVAGDCNDTLASVRPTAPEICDSLDNDCDSTVDENAVAIPWYVDLDGDGWGTVSAASPSIESCVPPAGRAIRPGDCDDGDGAVSPTAAEVCNGVDDDCNGRADYFIAAHDSEDDDRDGYPDADCGLPASVTSDCNDEDPLDSVPGTPELCDFHDNDCDGRVDEDTAPGDWYADVDGDGHGDPGSAPIRSCPIVPGRVRNEDDCDDTDRGTHPGAVDSCTTRLGVDDDCDGTIDEGGAHLTLFVDADDDGYGTGMAYAACLQDTHAATRDGDCDDADALRSPGGHDDCTGVPGVDDNCNGTIDETTTTPSYWADADGDGYGGGAPTATCSPAPGAVPNGDDCDDANRFRNPLVPDDCATARGVDDDCDGSVDEALALRDFYVDADHDGFGAGAAMPACTAPAGTVASGGDCDDASAARNPGAPDDCTRPMGIDDDCDSRIDEAATFVAVYRDVDGDGYGSGSSALVCGTPSGYVAQGGDCDETSISIHPGRADDCTTQLGVDDDCDGTRDEDVVLRSWYADADHDGYGVGTAMMACAAPANFAGASGDCDDTNASRSPGRADDCTGAASVDDDCDLRVDESATTTTLYRDADGDGFGDPALTTRSCGAVAGYVASATDCDDAHASARPGGDESVAGASCADAIDNDCDRVIDCADSGCSGMASCGSTMTVSSGDAQSAPIHALAAAPTIVHLVDGAGMPLVGRAVTLSTTSATSSVGYTIVTDASGNASFRLRAPLPLGTETIRFQALGIPDRTATITATAPAAGTLFSVLNGARGTNFHPASGPAYDQSGDGVTSIAQVTAGADGNVFFGAGDQIFRIRPDGSVTPFLGAGCCGVSGLVDGAPASSVHIGAAVDVNIAYDAPRGLLYFSRDCGLYSVDVATRTVHRVLGASGTCVESGDGGRALDATAMGILGIAVNDTGSVYFTQNGSVEGVRVLRFVDAGGSVHRVLRAQYTYGSVQLGAFLRRPVAIPGSSDVLFSSDCFIYPASVNCIVRTDVSGTNVQLVAGANSSDFTNGIDARMAPIEGNDWWFTALPNGEIWITSDSTQMIRRIDTMGRIYDVAGTRGMAGDAGDGGPASAGLLRYPLSPTAYLGSHVIFTDRNNRALRAIW